jgi:hypothetical protein
VLAAFDHGPAELTGTTVSIYLFASFSAKRISLPAVYRY